MLKRSTGPFGHTLGRSTGWIHRAELARNQFTIKQQGLLERLQTLEVGAFKVV